MKLITGKKGKAHVTAKQFRSILETFAGSGSFIADLDERMDIELSTDNKVKIRSGLLIHHGSAMVVETDTYDEVTYQNGTQGMRRIDLIVARYTKDLNTNTEESDWVVIQGTPDASDPVAPGYIVGNMQKGDAVDDCPMYELHFDGLNVTEIKKLVDTGENIETLKEMFDELNSELESTKKELDTDLNTLNTNLTNHTHSNATTSKSGFMTANMVIKHNAINDYVTKITKGANYTYREWASGIKELWLKTIISTSVSVPWGSWYIVGPLSVNFPITFSSARHVQLCVSASNDIAVPIFCGYSTSWAKFYLARGDILSSAQSFEIEVYVIGT